MVNLAICLPNNAGSPPTILRSVTFVYPHSGGCKGPYAVFMVPLEPRSPSTLPPIFPLLLLDGQQTCGSLPSKPQTEARRKLRTVESCEFDSSLSNSWQFLILTHTPDRPCGFWHNSAMFKTTYICILYV